MALRIGDKLFKMKLPETSQEANTVDRISNTLKVAPTIPDVLSSTELTVKRYEKRNRRLDLRPYRDDPNRMTHPKAAIASRECPIEGAVCFTAAYGVVSKACDYILEEGLEIYCSHVDYRKRHRVTL